MNYSCVIYISIILKEISLLTWKIKGGGYLSATHSQLISPDHLRSLKNEQPLTIDK